ncbi:hypothetical protein ROS217_04725 [Roseovarius sp. 217]|nr:hypothetical protein ROS217_04725 [Roseovarius sp. 217]
MGALGLHRRSFLSFQALGFLFLWCQIMYLFSASAQSFSRKTDFSM